MYYIGADNNIYRIGNFKRRIPPELSNGRIINNDDVSIQAVGKDPNTGKIIEDVEVGKYIDGQFLFNRELSPTDISNLTGKYEEISHHNALLPIKYTFRINLYNHKQICRLFQNIVLFLFRLFS